MYIMIDNYDSFVYNLAAYFKELGQRIEVIRNDAADIETLYRRRDIRGIIISPGPKNPGDCGKSAEIVRAFAGRVPILGVCLGHQIIGHVFGAGVKKGEQPMHGKTTPVCHEGRGLFRGLAQRLPVTRYHSLVVSESGLSETLRIDARSEDGVVMALSHRNYPIYGVQFHPEAVLTESGHAVLSNFIRLSEEWWCQNENKNNRMAS
ncbi:aminodeoxychorismate/anthranilate synthase component II [Eubacterium sp. 1001713B170207_170306_E7]|uniref:anthranilate synthase component II n=1 Tax=Eubacterium sp. 1001713B170207_170306_E7 TaxID=2787097 RepID=UPI0018983306|nr:aminodeoxychorismate/anthranilate synthase component II [Eubacterium sp. 1001713B170207_170306_E7]